MRFRLGQWSHRRAVDRAVDNSALSHHAIVDDRSAAIVTTIDDTAIDDTTAVVVRTDDFTVIRSVGRASDAAIVATCVGRQRCG